MLPIFTMPLTRHGENMNDDGESNVIQYDITSVNHESDNLANDPNTIVNIFETISSKNLSPKINDLVSDHFEELLA